LLLSLIVEYSYLAAWIKDVTSNYKSHVDIYGNEGWSKHTKYFFGGKGKEKFDEVALLPSLVRRLKALI
jgi:hypothetical protein